MASPAAVTWVSFHISCEVFQLGEIIMLTSVLGALSLGRS